MVAHETSKLIMPRNEFERKHAPERLFLEGDVSLLTKGTRVSVVGSRKPSEAGHRRARAFVQALVRHNIIVVSGLAAGIDTVAHETAVEAGGKTIAVLGTPLNQAYPACNAGLLERIKAEYLAVSQFPAGRPSKRGDFPCRNRTMALISDATVIAEASEKSGTRHQGWEALRLGRMVFLMESVATDQRLSWPKQMIDYGAEVLTRESLEEALINLPSFTAEEELAF